MTNSKNGRSIQHTNAFRDHFVEMGLDGFTMLEMMEIVAQAARWAAEDLSEKEAA